MARTRLDIIEQFEEGGIPSIKQVGDWIAPASPMPQGDDYSDWLTHVCLTFRSIFNNLSSVQNPDNESMEHIYECCLRIDQEIEDCRHILSPMDAVSNKKCVQFVRHQLDLYFNSQENSDVS